jgi:hypothetical protein
MQHQKPPGQLGGPSAPDSLAWLAMLKSDAERGDGLAIATLRKIAASGIFAPHEPDAISRNAIRTAALSRVCPNNAELRAEADQIAAIDRLRDRSERRQAYDQFCAGRQRRWTIVAKRKTPAQASRTRGCGGRPRGRRPSLGRRSRNARARAPGDDPGGDGDPGAHPRHLGGTPLWSYLGGPLARCASAHGRSLNDFVVGVEAGCSGGPWSLQAPRAVRAPTKGGVA